MQAPKLLNISITPFTAEDIPTLVTYQQTMAKETEDKDLSSETVTEALEHMVENRSYGQYFMAKLADTNEPVGCTMITYAFDVLTQDLNIWYQSVYVDKQYRNQKVFTRLFRHVEELASHLKATGLYLYVEKENTSAQSIYEKLGMHKSSQTFVEKDFYFYHQAEAVDGSHLYNFEFNTISRDSKQPLSVDELFDMIKANDTPNVVFHTDNKHFSWSEQSLCLKVYREGVLVGLFTGFVEISDWRNGLSVYISDYSTDVEPDAFVRLLKELEASITNGCPLGMKTTVIRFVVLEDDKKLKELESAGYQLEHYYVYEKAVKKLN